MFFCSPVEEVVLTSCVVKPSCVNAPDPIGRGLQIARNNFFSKRIYLSIAGRTGSLEGCRIDNTLQTVGNSSVGTPYAERSSGIGLESLARVAGALFSEPN